MSDAPGWNVIEGDCLATMRGMDDNSVDLIATDPPYGISFMEKKWDTAIPDPTVWRECLRVLKPGGSACIMSGSRLDCLWRMCRDIEAAGFELSQTALYWVYRSGFPKGGDLSKMADKQAGAERKVVGRHPFASRRPNVRPGGGKIICQEGGDLGTPTLTTPSSPLAVSLDGWFTKGKVKPAVEVIIWARKPISEKTELANMERWGVGGVNCGACMVPVVGKDSLGDPARFDNMKTSCMVGEQNRRRWVDARVSNGEKVREYHPQAGRFPANLLCTDDAIGEGSRYFDVDAWAAEHGYAEDGWAEAAAAGMLQIAKPSQSEKNAGCEALKQKPVRPAGSGFKECTIFNGENGDDEWRAKNPSNPAHNSHPTCKPVRLFAYLCDFLCPAGGTILDPFCGSGTTGVASIQSGRSFIGCELEPDYVKIAEARIAHASSVEVQGKLSM